LHRKVAFQQNVPRQLFGNELERTVNQVKRNLSDHIIPDKSLSKWREGTSLNGPVLGSSFRRGSSASTQRFAPKASTPATAPDAKRLRYGQTSGRLPSPLQMAYLEAGLQHDFRNDCYSGLKGIYFFRILKTIIRLGALDRRDISILDFGCGTGQLRHLLPGKVIGYDIIPELSEISNWRMAQFDVVVANEVFYLFHAQELRHFLAQLRRVNPSAELLVGISRQGLVNNVLKHLAGEPDSHLGTKLGPKEELELLTEELEILDRASVFQLCDVYYMRYKDRPWDRFAMTRASWTPPRKILVDGMAGQPGVF
jgi:SAM-dependent methyltransferase